MFTNLLSAKKPSDRDKLPRPEDFPKALYTFDIGQNDLSVGFRQSYEQLRASIPDIVNKFTASIQVSWCVHPWLGARGNGGILLTFSWILQHLYQGGARTFWIHNTGPVGCLPVAVMYIRNPPPGMLDQCGCNKAQNEMAMEFNKQLKDGVMRLRAQLPEAAITYVDLYAAKYGLISDAKNQGERIFRPTLKYFMISNPFENWYKMPKVRAKKILNWVSMLLIRCLSLKMERVFNKSRFSLIHLSLQVRADTGSH